MSKLGMLRADRDRAANEKDWGRWRCRSVELAGMGWVEPHPAMETVQAADGLETVVPEKPRRGRRPRPRCEHGMILDRCPECNDELAAA